MTHVGGGVTYPQGFLASGVRAGLKEKGNDIALIFSEVPAVAVGAFSTNVVKAACVQIDRERVPSSSVRAIVVNSGIANSCTGERGTRDALETASVVARELDISEKDVLIGSTGVIGRLLPMRKMRAGISEAVRCLSRDGGGSAALAIMTTDTRPKEAVAEAVISGRAVRIGGMAKGSGMICPNLATMLSYITTDASINAEMLQTCLIRSVDASLNCLTIDGDSSTNDMVIVLANGMAGNRVIDGEGPDLTSFQKALDEVTMSLARQLARDGEGATKLIEVRVSGADDFEAARRIAKTIANSPLVKTAMFGCDPNWGRILAAAGRAGIDFSPASVQLRIGDMLLLRNGEPVAFSDKEASAYLKGSDVLVQLKVGAGTGEAAVWTCDFSYEYVRINAEYHT